jgi:predicted Zn-dependent protease
MKRVRRFATFALALVLISGWLFPAATTGITIKEEEELSREFLKYISKAFTFVDDPLIVGYVNGLGNRLLAKFPPQPFPYRFYVIKEDVLNAFATPAGHIFVYSGLIAALDDEDELAGIMAHEISHVYCRHISQKIERSKKINMATMAGVAAGIFLGMAGGGAEAATALSRGAMAAGTTAELSFSREDEVQADQVGLPYLKAAGYNGEGLLKALNKIRENQWWGTDQVPSYMMTHPAVEDRLAYISTYLEGQPDRKTKTAGDPFFYGIVRARVVSLYGDENTALREFENRVKTDPSDAIGYYGYGLALARSGRRAEAIDELKKALALKAFEPTFLSGLGRVYFMEGKYEEARTALEGALSLDANDAEGLFYMGRTQLELGRPADAAAALDRLRQQGFVNPQVFYFLGKAQGAGGNLAEAHYNLGLYYYVKRDYSNARVQFNQALEKTQDPERKRDIEDRLKQIKKILSEEERS